MKKIFLLPILILSGFSLIAQIDTFNLSSYKLPEIKRHQLDLNFDLNGMNSSYDRYQRLYQDYWRKSIDMDGNIGLDYKFYRNSVSYQGSQDLSFDFGSSYTNREYVNSANQEGYTLEGSLHITSENRFYLNNKFFLESNIYLNESLSKLNYNSNSLDERNRYENNSISVPLGLGIGRIEQVQDAWLAIYILDELEKQGKLTRLPTQEEIIEFTDVISKLKNERFFDARLQKIKEIEELDAFLQSKGLINEPNAKYFAIVNDNWDNVATQIRYSGKRFSFQVTPGYNSSYDFSAQTNYDYEMRKTEYFLNIGLDYRYEKPLNVHWQNSFDIYIWGRYLKGTINDLYNDSKSNVESPQIKSSIFNRIIYYPNSRTNISVRVGLIFNNYFGTEHIENVKNDVNHFELIPASGLTLNYYISPQLLLKANYNVQYYYVESNSEYFRNILIDDFIKEKQLYQSINVRFVYQIF